MRRVVPLVALAALLTAGAARAQTYTPVCEDQSGSALLACLRSGYTPASTYPYDRARDTLFSFVDDGDRRTITDVYAGRVVPIPLGADPTIAGCNGDGDNNASSCSGALNINTEHVYPQSKGASAEPARGDMHHLYPARAEVNSSRGNDPFGAFEDTQASVFYKLTQKLTCPSGCPPADVDAWSARSSSLARFRPRAEVRGDLARAVFYFYTVYRDRADAADPGFFGLQKDVLLAWHRADPPTAAEQARSARVKRYQGNDNPFVLDTSLVARAYFPTLLPAELASFSATSDGDAVVLHWSTTSETNNAGFQIEHQAPGADAFREIAFEAGAGTSAERHDYARTLADLAAGRHAFRLRQVDFDGARTYSAVVEASVATDRILLAVYPSPARTHARATLALPAPGPARVSVYDALGREVAVMFDGYAATTQALTLDVSGLAPGVYVVRAVAGREAITRTLVVAR